MALAAAAAVALEGIVATRAMVGLDTNIVMTVQKLLSAIMFGVVLLVIPGGIATVGSVMAIAGLIVPIVCAGMIAAYSYVVWYRSIREIGVARAMALNISYAMWGAVLAWILHDAPLTLLALAGCAVVTAGAVLTILSGRDESTRAASTSCRSAARLAGGTRTPEHVGVAAPGSCTAREARAHAARCARPVAAVHERRRARSDFRLDRGGVGERSAVRGGQRRPDGRPAEPEDELG